MEVIGIVQTDLNEFNILFEDGNKQQNNANNQADADFFNFLNDNDNTQNNQRQGNNQGQNQQYQEMIVRIKGIPEGQKATFLQMYQIIQDAKEMKDLEKQCTVVEVDDQQQQGNNRGSSMH